MRFSTIRAAGASVVGEQRGSLPLWHRLRTCDPHIFKALHDASFRAGSLRTVLEVPAVS